MAPLAARLPARIAYRVACQQGDWTFSQWSARDADGVHLRRLLAPALGDAEAERVMRDFCRFRACEVIDVMLTRGDARALSRLVEIRGRGNLEEALRSGRGALLCTAHFGSHLSASSLLHAAGFPLTTIGRWDWRYDTQISELERRLWDRIYARRVLRHRQRPNIEPWQGRPQVAVQVAGALRRNEVVTISSDAPPLSNESARAVPVPFLGRQANLLSGVVTLAELTGAPILMMFMHRLPDYRHQVLEISAPIPLDDGPQSAFQRCVAAMEAAIRANPADWYFWFQPHNLQRLGLLGESDRGEALAR